MSFREKQLHRPVRIIQVFKQIHTYGKNNKASEERKITNIWQPIQSRSGQYINGILYLPYSTSENVQFTNIDLLLMVDDTSLRTSESVKEKENKYLFNLSHPKKWEIFEIQINENVELHLRYNHFDIGEPARENFKLCDLKPGKPVEVQINGKIDFSLTSRRARSYKEQYYILEYLGDADQIKLPKNQHFPVPKEIPPNRKIINLLKPLW